VQKAKCTLLALRYKRGKEEECLHSDEKCQITNEAKQYGHPTELCPVERVGRAMVVVVSYRALEIRHTSRLAPPVMFVQN
jgi:hypothetical protein